MTHLPSFVIGDEIRPPCLLKRVDSIRSNERVAIMSDDPVLTPGDLHREQPRWTPQSQRRHRISGDFIPFIKIGNRVFYKRSSVTRFLAENEQTIQSRQDSDHADG